REVDRPLVVTGVVKAAGRSAIGKSAVRNEVRADYVQRIEAELDGDALHQPLQRVVDLRSAEATDKAGGGLVGQHDAVADGDVPDVIRAGRVAVDAVEGCRLGRPRIGAAILDLVPIESGYPPLRINRRTQNGDAIGRRHRGAQ